MRKYLLSLLILFLLPLATFADVPTGSPYLFNSFTTGVGQTWTLNTTDTTSSRLVYQWDSNPYYIVFIDPLSGSFSVVEGGVTGDAINSGTLSVIGNVGTVSLSDGSTDTWAMTPYAPTGGSTGGINGGTGSNDTTGLYDTANGNRSLLADIRQVLCWLCGLVLVQITIHSLRTLTA